MVIGLLIQSLLADDPVEIFVVVGAADPAWTASAAVVGICSAAAAAAGFYPPPIVSVFVPFFRNILLG